MRPTGLWGLWGYRALLQVTQLSVGSYKELFLFARLKFVPKSIPDNYTKPKLRIFFGKKAFLDAMMSMKINVP